MKGLSLFEHEGGVEKKPVLFKWILGSGDDFWVCQRDTFKPWISPDICNFELFFLGIILKFSFGICCNINFMEL